ncbi:MAG: hypothetical protein FJ298_16230, partial [Planctomycetes bacterium]|nr:hypothetical protein [Planctomycetota bacterium]
MREKGYVVFAHSIQELMPDSYVPKPNALSDGLSCTLARGEYKSLQIGVHALSEELKEVSLDVECDLGVQVYHLAQTTDQAPDGQVPNWAPAAAFLVPGSTRRQVVGGQSGGFWVTFHAGADADVGQHPCKVRIQCAGKPATELDLNLRVRTFELAPARVAFGMYHYNGYVPVSARTDRWQAAMYRDMAAHGQTSVTFHEGGDFATLPPKEPTATVRAAIQAGLVHRHIPCMLLQDNLADLSEAQRRAAVAWLQDQHETQGWPELVRYGIDEPPYPSAELRRYLLPWRELPIRMVTAMNAQAAYGHGDLHDIWVVMGGEITPEMRAEAQRLGAEVWTYSFRIWREEFNPLRQRHYAGLYTWANKLGGNFIWAYYHDQHSHVWRFRDGDEQPMPVVNWEARREGIDDYRYLQMLQDCVAARSDDPLAVEARTWMEALRARITVDPHV